MAGTSTTTLSWRRSMLGKMGLSRKARDRLLGYGLLLPACLLVFGLVAYPTLYTIVLSFTDTQGFGEIGSFVFLDNFWILINDARFWEGVRNTVVVGGATVVLEVLLGVATGLLLWWKFPGRAVIFIAVFIPWVYPAAFSGFAWYWMLVPPFHTFYTLDVIHLRHAVDTAVGSGWWDFLSVVILNVWRGSSFIAIFVLAALNAIPTELLDYARIESNSAWKRFQLVIAPLIWPFLVLSVLVAVVTTYVDFTNVYEASGERVFEPLLLTQSYLETIQHGRVGLGAAINVIQLPFIALLLAVSFSFIDRSPTLHSDSTAPSSELLTRAGRAPSGPQRQERTSFSHQPPPRSSHAATAIPPGLRRRGLITAGGVAVFLIAVFHLLPIYWTVMQSLTPFFVVHSNPFWTVHPTLEAYRGVLGSDEFWIWMQNTAVIFGLALVLTLACSLLAGYALGRFELPGNRWIARVLFASYFIPQTAVVVPVFRVFVGLHLADTPASVILLFQTLTIPFCTWLFYIYFRGLPTDLEENALLDGNRIAVFRHVVLRMSWPMIVAAGVFSIGIMASDLLYSSTFLIHHGQETVTVGLAVIAISLDEFSNVTGGIGIAALPIVFVAAAFAPSYVRGLTAAMLEGA